jgi:hypothetical protein
MNGSPAVFRSRFQRIFGNQKRDDHGARCSARYRASRRDRRQQRDPSPSPVQIAPAQPCDLLDSCPASAALRLPPAHTLKPSAVRSPWTRPAVHDTVDSRRTIRRPIGENNRGTEQGASPWSCHVQATWWAVTEPASPSPFLHQAGYPCHCIVRQSSNYRLESWPCTRYKMSPRFRL